MRRILVLGAAVAAFGTLVATTALAAPTPVPFPAPSVGPVFIAAHTTNTAGTMASWFAPGSTVVFRAYALDTKTDKVIAAAKDVKYFYVTIPNQPNVKLHYNPTAPGATARMPWTGTWTVPLTYPAGLVKFKILIKTNAKRNGEFVQMPVATSDLNISSTAPTQFPTGPTNAAQGVSDPNLALYADSVNGTAPAGAPVRPIGCTQTNVYRRGERIVVRTWGFDLKDGATLSNDNVDTATFTIAGQAPVTLAYGAHGAAGAQVYFWSNFFIVPASFPLGNVNITVAFKTVSGRTATVDYPITIIP